MNQSIYIPPSGAGLVTSVFNRTGSIISTIGDYTIDQITNGLSTALLGANNGIATLDSGGKLTIAQLPTIPTQYKGTWNATTNSPTLANGIGTVGDFYYTGTAGSINFGAGSITFAINDVVIYNGSIWQKVASTVTQINSDWSSGSGFSQILNKPTTFTTLGVQVATNKLLGRGTAGTGVPEEIILGTGLLLTGTTLSVTSSATIDNLGAGTLVTITPVGSAIAYNGNIGTIQKVILITNSTVTISNLKIGIPYTFLVYQNGTGNWAMTLSPTCIVAYNGLGSIPVSIAANSKSKYVFTYDGTNIWVDYGTQYS